MFVYGDEMVEDILLILTKKETKIVDRSFEKFNYICDCKELRGYIK